MRQFFEFVRSELTELETRDVDQLFDCIKENLEDMGVRFDEGLEDELYEEIRSQVAKIMRGVS